MAFLEDLVKYAKLNLPGNKKVAELYRDNERQKQLEELRSQGNYPNLESYLESAKQEGISEYSPLKHIGAKIKLKFLKSTTGLLYRLTNDEKYKNVNESMQEFENAFDKAHEAASISLSQYKKIVSNIKKVSREENTDYKTVIENQEYLDKAFRKAMPNKEKTESLENKKFDLYKDSLETIYDAKSMLDKSGLNKENQYNIKMNIPEKNEIQDLFKSVKNYADKEVNRIYS